MITLAMLDDAGGVRHAFFTRRGGVSEGLFGSLNCGFGAGDAEDKVARNRAIAMDRLDLSADRLVTCRQIHSATVIPVERPWRREDAPRADGMVTRSPGVALGVLSADCAPILFYDPAAKVIGAAHGGWRGALGGVVEATVDRMQALGAKAGQIRAAIGPCIGSRSYEVGPEFPQPFIAEDPSSLCYFTAAGRLTFDLAGYIEYRLARTGVVIVQHARNDTVAEEGRFFSYRRACLRGERFYGRGLSAIALEA